VSLLCSYHLVECSIAPALLLVVIPMHIHLVVPAKASNLNTICPAVTCLWHMNCCAASALDVLTFVCQLEY
jgi:hypothetical protein